MTTVRFPAALAITVFSLASHEAFAQAAPEPAATTAGGKAWSFSVSALTYLLPDEPDYAQPTFAADHGRLHLEARYNYEGLHAGSAWAGCNFAVGSDVELALTPMIGVVFGDTSGVAAGYEASLLWRKLDLSSESEYVFDTGESSGSFFYTWSELGWTPVAWLRLGLVVQRTRVYQTDFDIQRGLLAGIAYRSASFTAYVFDPDAGQPTVVLGASLEF